MKAMTGKILVVDDSRVAAEMISRQLRARGHEVVAVTDGEAGLRTLLEDNFSLVILDVNMPGLDGFAVAERIRALHEDLFLPILFLSADAARDTHVRSLRQGGTVYMTKPFNEEVFAAQVESLLVIKDLQDNLAQKNRLLEEMCRRDSLTNLYNHSYFQELVDHQFRSSRRYEHPLSCILLDLDRFKQINDTFGHPTGDRVLTELADLLHRCVREVDVVSRYGGEEFGLLLPMTDAAGAELVAERIRNRVAEHVFDAEIRRLRLTCSLGVASIGPSVSSARELIEFADRALYLAKRTGRNRVCRFDPESCPPVPHGTPTQAPA